MMGQAYPELLVAQKQIERVIETEEAQFARTLQQGLKIFEQDLNGIKGTVISGEVAFKLYDTYGFPADLTADMARERGLTVDLESFELLMDQQRDRARASSQFAVDYNHLAAIDCRSQFTGYTELTGESTIQVLLNAQGKPVDHLNEGETGALVAADSPFYAESGGQVGDLGRITAKGMLFQVTDTQKQGESIVHLGQLKKGGVRKGQTIELMVDSARRQATALNHSATHLLHAALRQVLGAHVEQKGSLVAPDRLRFDFTHFAAIKEVELNTIESLVNAQIRANLKVETMVTDIQSAKKWGP